MASNMSVKLGLDVSAYNQGIQEATKETKQYTNQVTELTKDLPNLKKEFGQVNRQAQALTLAISKLTEEQKNSAEGRVMIKALDEAKNKAAELKDMMGDLAEEIKNKASDTRPLDALKDGIGVLGNSFSALAGTIGIVTGKEEQMKRAVVAFTTVQSTLNAITSIQNALQKQSALMDGIRTIQLKAKTLATNINTGATEANTVATGAATVAQAAFNAVANANPYVLLATAILGLAAAVGTYVIATDGATDAEEKRKQKIEELRQKEKNYAEQIGNKYGELIVKYKTLQSEWNKLSTLKEKNKFLKEHKNELTQLGAKIDNVRTAESYFVDKSDDVVQAFILRAKAAAAAARATEAYSKAMAAEQFGGSKEAFEGMFVSAEQMKSLPKQLQESLRKKAEAQTKSTGVVNREQGGITATGQYMHSVSGYNNIQEVTGYFLKNVTDAEAAGLRAAGKIGTKVKKEVERLNKEGDEYIQKAVDYEEQAGKLTGDFNTNITTDVDKSTKEIKYLAGSLAELEARLNKLKSDQTNGFINLDAEEFKTQVKSLEDQIKEKKIQLGLEVPEDENEKIRKQISDIMALVDDPKETKIKLNVSGLSDDLQEEAQKAYDAYSVLFDMKQQFEKMLENPDLNTDQYEMIQNAIHSISDEYELATENVKKYNEASAVNIDVEKQATKAAEEKAKADEQKKEFVDALVDSTKILGDSEEAQMVQFSTNTAAILADTIKTITAMNAKAIASGAASAFALPFPANLAAWATVLTTITSIFSSLPKFSQGGVLDGPYKTGDRLLARVNAGERILTETQQKNLDKALDGDRLYSGSNAVQVQGVTTVRGTDLDIVWSNYNRNKKRVS